MEGVLNALATVAFIAGILALVALIWLYIRPIQTASIKVPVATDQASYYPGEDISGIFFGDTYHTGEVRVLREVFCKNYKGVIKPPPESAMGDFFSTQSKPRHLEGESIVVGNLPPNIPVGANCVLQFTNVYEIQTPFGPRKIEYQYYTQNFSIVTRERRLQLECEASGRKGCNFIIDVPGQQKSASVDTPAVQSSPETAPTVVNNDNRTQSTTTTNTAAADPAPRYVDQCTVNLLGVKILCRKVAVQ